MPADDEKTTVEVSQDAAPDGAARGGGNKLLLFGGIGVAFLVIGIALALFVVGPMMSDSKGGDQATHEEVDEAEPEAKHKSTSGKKARGEHGGSQSIVYAIKDIVVNPAGTGGSRFLSVSFGFELSSAGLAGDFEAREPLVRDALITILSSKTVAQLTDVRQKEIIRYQIKKRLSQLMKTDELKSVYYTDFVLQ